jgi:hypothetical protein
MSVEATVGDLSTGNLSDILCNDQAYDLSVTLRKPTCASAGVGEVALKYSLKGAKLDSQSFSSAIGSNKTVSLSWSVPIAGPEDITRGLFLSGVQI